MVEAARIAQSSGSPLNRHLTIRTQALVETGAEGRFTAAQHMADAVKELLELLRKWVKARGTVWACIWVRETSTRAGEHLHVAFHGPPGCDLKLAQQVAAWTGEGIGPTHSRQIIAKSECGAWELRKCTRSSTSGTDLAAYLGKSEPNEISRWGKRRPNLWKLRPAKCEAGGVIEGTAGRAFRHGFSRNINPRSRPTV